VHHCSAADDDACRVRVTSLSPEGEEFVRELEDGFDTFLEHWRRVIGSVAADG